jgi:hypothetical protein
MHVGIKGEDLHMNTREKHGKKSCRPKVPIEGESLSKKELVITQFFH